jgi:hypothetical protein
MKTFEKKENQKLVFRAFLLGISIGAFAAVVYYYFS